MQRYHVDRPTIDVETDHDAATSSREPVRPDKVGRYITLDVLGMGGMGVVCTAYDPKLDRKVAIKLLRHTGSADQRRATTGQARLVREAQALAKLSHPNIVTVHDVDTYQGQIYMAMEYVEGQSLDEWMTQPHSWREVLDVFIEAGRGLAAAHEAGITHRDFKPANVLLAKDGRVKVVDFGLAKSTASDSESGPVPSLEDSDGDLMDMIGASHDAKLTQAGRTVGTPAYMAPEQFLGLAVKSHTDQFSFGVALYEALYGDLPFPEQSREDLVEIVTTRKATEPAGTTVPSWVFRIVQRTLQPHPDDRFDSMAEVLAALEADPAKRRRKLAAATAGVALMGLGAFGLYWYASGADVCSGADERLEAVWSSTRQDEVQAAFLATDKPFAQDTWVSVDKELDRYGKQWVELHTEVCEATNVRREQSEALMDVRMACLERGHRELAALVDLLATADGDTVEHAVDAAQDLSDVDRCTSVVEDHTALDDPVLAAGVHEVDALLAKTKAFDRTGQPAKALALAEEALDRATELDYAPTLAWAQYYAATQRLKRSQDKSKVRADLVDAIRLAAQTGQPSLEVYAWTKLMRLEAVVFNRPAEALALRLPADIALERADDPVASAALSKTLGIVHDSAHDYEAALGEFLVALDKYERRYGSQHHAVVGLWINVGGLYGKLQRYPEARDALDRAIVTIERISGPHHPLLASALVNRGSVLAANKSFAEARDNYARALEIFEQVLPPDHVDTLRPRLGLASVEEDLGHRQKARETYEAVLPILERSGQPNLELLVKARIKLGLMLDRMAKDAKPSDPAQAEMLWQQAREQLSLAIGAERQRAGGASERGAKIHVFACQIELGRGDTAAAREQCGAAWDLYREPSMSAEGGADALSMLVDVHRRDGDLDGAVTLLREGIERFEEAGESSAATRLMLTLAEVLWDLDRRSEAVAEAKRARELRRRAGQAELAHEVERWLRGHGTSP